MKNNKKTKILITGGAGFIGSNLTKTLLEQGKQVFCIDNLNNYYSPEIKKKNIEQFSRSASRSGSETLQGRMTGGKDNPNYTFKKIDIKDQEELENIFKKNKFTTVIHLAARAGVRASIEDPSKYIQTNIQGTLNLLECLKETPDTKFIFASSSSVYGNITQV
ncbi:GDP-mannose 4,6-dehydratase, partial [bacterium]|nr:GDP-mannose 4,6-dehydratase [bacterium]